MKRACLTSFETFRHCLGNLDFRALPGLDAQLRMAPQIRHSDLRSRGKDRDVAMSSVLMLIYPLRHNCPGIVLIQRPEYNGVHSGQISFPGGRYEENIDVDTRQTALREAREEIGIEPENIHIAGKLTDLYIPPSNFLVFPYVAVTETRPHFKPNPLEVSSVIEIELSEFFLEENCVSRILTMSDGFRVEVPCYYIKGYTIWGATAMILAEFLEMLQKSGYGPQK